MKLILTLITISALLCGCDEAVNQLAQSNSGKAKALVDKYMKGHLSSDSYEQEDGSFEPDSVFISLDSIAVADGLASVDPEFGSEMMRNQKGHKFSGFKLDYSFKQKNANGELTPHNWTFYFNKPLADIHHIRKD